jgi:two-component system cell cycle sensor histidine kinase/response regulator CckA
MKSSFRILHLEDSRVDCELIHQLLEDDGLHCEMIQCDNREKFIQDLQANELDLIFADCTLPQFSGLHALELAKQYAPEIPFIFVSGTIEEDSAIESLRCGATDYVLKNRLSRLVPAVRRALAETRERNKNREMEQRLREAQHLEAVGTLAGGIAHDFNNILTIIKGNASLLPLESESPEQVREIGATIDRASARGSELVNQLLAFARKSDGRFTSTMINQRVEEVATMLRPAMPQNIAFELQLEADLPKISADAGQVERVLVNLATNARDAMPQGGTLTFATSAVSAQDVPLSSGQDVEHYLCLRVSDTGFGMDEATRHRIFEPFFTTKPLGKGTGLGMPVVYGLMQSHNGFIDVQSERGKGTSISLYFPIPTEAPPQAIERPLVSTPVAKGSETILIVDDEKDVRYFLEIILNLNGYRVLAASSAEAALEMLSSHPDEIHVLFSDVGLPQLDGFDLSKQAKVIRPRLKTILCSGYVDTKLKMRMAQENIDGFVPKPYETATLLQTMRSILDNPEEK